SPLEQMRRRPRVVVVALRRLLFKNLNIRPVAGFSSELPFRDRLPKQFLVGDSAFRARPEVPRNARACAQSDGDRRDLQSDAPATRWGESHIHIGLRSGSLGDSLR